MNVKISLQFNIQEKEILIFVCLKKERKMDIHLGQPIWMPIYADLLIAPAVPSCIEINIILLHYIEIKNDFTTMIILQLILNNYSTMSTFPIALGCVHWHHRYDTD
jgi:hypothetical protein